MQPPFSMVARIAQTLKVPQAYFFCEDDALAEVTLRFQQLSADEKAEILARLRELTGS